MFTAEKIARRPKIQHEGDRFAPRISSTKRDPGRKSHAKTLKSLISRKETTLGTSGFGGFLPAFSPEMRTFREKLGSFLLANVGASGRVRRIPAIGPAATPS